MILFVIRTIQMQTNQLAPILPLTKGYLSEKLVLMPSSAGWNAAPLCQQILFPGRPDRQRGGRSGARHYARAKGAQEAAADAERQAEAARAEAQRARNRARLALLSEAQQAVARQGATERFWEDRDWQWLYNVYRVPIEQAAAGRGLTQARSHRKAGSAPIVAICSCPRAVPGAIPMHL